MWLWWQMSQNLYYGQAGLGPSSVDDINESPKLFSGEFFFTQKGLSFCSR